MIKRQNFSFVLQKNFIMKGYDLEMKKFFAILLCAALLLTTGIPAFAAESNVPPDKVIQLAKNTFQIPADFTVFRYNTQKDEQSGLTLYFLSWEQSGDSPSSIEVIADENGYFYQYHLYVPRDSDSTALPSLSKQEALNAALSFAKTILPESADEITADRAQIDYSYDTYEVRFERDINGIRVANSALELSIDKNDGSLISYRACNWPTGIEIDSDSNLIDSETARSKFQENLPLTLQYISIYNENTEKNQTLLVYAPPKGYDTSFLDAHTGEVISLDSLSYYGYNDSAAEATADSSKGDNGLTEEELAEIEKHNNLVTTDELLEKLAQMNALDFSETLALASSSVSSVVSRYSDNVFYRTNLEFQPDASNKRQSAVFDAESGELLSFYAYDMDADEQDLILSETAAEKAAAEFLQAYKSGKYAQTKLEEEESYLHGGSYQFQYVRQVNGVPFYNNYITVTVNGTSGKITYMSEAWNSDAVFEETDGSITQAQANDSYFNFYGIEYFYLPVAKDQQGNLTYIPEYTDVLVKQSLIPVYAYEFNSCIDAQTGEVLTRSGEKAEPYTRYSKLDNLYPQLIGHYVSDIAMKLYDAGITLSDPNFDPDANITAGEFKELIENLDYRSAVSFNSSQIEVTDANATLTRMDAVKNIIKAMGYEKIAKNTEIFQCPFADKDAIGADNIGYAALAKGLGIASGSNNCFMPDKTITNAEALVMIYNCLNQN